MTSIIPINPANPDYPDQTICDLGIGHTEMYRWNNLDPFNNFLFEVDEWQERYTVGGLFTGYQPLYDLSGWVRALRPGTTLACYPFGGKGSGTNGQYYSTGTWIMEFDGSGMMRFGSNIGSLFEKVISGPGTKQVTALITNTTQSGWSWELVATDPNNPLRPKAIYLSGLDKNGVNRRFMNTWKHARVMRFMDWQFMNTNSQFNLSGGRTIRIQNAAKAFADQLTPGLIFSGTQSGARGRVEDLDFSRCFLSGDLGQNGGWAPSAINGIIIYYSPLTSTYFNYAETIDFGFSTARVGKMVSAWDLAVCADRGAYPHGTGEASGPPIGGFNGYNPSPGWLDPMENRWQGDGLANWANHPINSDIRPVPVVKMIQICNEAFCDMWINIPMHLNESSTSAYFTYINNNLAPGLKVYAEHCNEPWNTAFVTRRHLEQLGHVFSAGAPLAGTPSESYRRAYAIEAFKRLKIAKSIMSGTREIETVMNIQSTDVGFGDIVFDWTGLPAGFSTYVDSVSIAPYFGNKGIQEARFLPEFAPIDLTGHPDHLYNLTSGQILNRLELTCVPNALGTLASTLNMCIPRGYYVNVYECGHHVDNPGFYMPRGLDDTSATLGPLANAYRAKMLAVHNSQQMGRIYFYYFAQMGRLLQYRVPAVHYNSVTRYDDGTFWGLITHYDRLGVKYQAWLLAIMQCNESMNGPQSGSSSNQKTFTARKSSKRALGRRSL